jgi:hypothetical protein
MASLEQRGRDPMSKLQHAATELARTPKLALTLALALAFGRALAESDTFDTVAAGAVPPSWNCGTTGGGTPRWSIESDPDARSKPNLLKQSGHATFAWCVRTDASIRDGSVEVNFKPLSGHEDQAGGLVWRFKNAQGYYVARANALENNVSLYYVENGRRITIKYVDAPVQPRSWHRLRVEFSGPAIVVSLDGEKVIELEDRHVTGPGAVGVWTKSDSVTAFDDFRFDRK